MGCSSSECAATQVLERGEDCDVHGDSRLGRKLACGERGTAAECRYVCETSDTCPVGWDCGSDGTCRRASNEVRRVPSSPGWSPASFEPVDFNGDGRADLVGAFEQRIEFRTGDGSGAFPTVYSVSTLPVSGAAAVGNLDGDANGDVLLPTPEGFLVWRGQPEGPPLQAAYAAIALPVDGAWGIPLAHRASRPDGALAVLYEMNENLMALVVAGGQWHNSIVVSEGVKLEETSGRFAVSDLDGDLDDDIAFGLQGGAEVTLFGIRRDTVNGALFLGGLENASPTQVDVSRPGACPGCPETLSGVRVNRGLRIADVDGDGDQDLLVSATSDVLGTDAVVVVRGDGQGRFADAHVDSRFEYLASPRTVRDHLSDGHFSKWPIAAGDLSGDGVADYVSPNGVFVACSTPPHALVQASFRENPHPWTAAVLADVDGDGRADVVAVGEGKPFVDVLLRRDCRNASSSCPTTACFAQSRYPTELGITKLRTGRLQGLAATDIVLVESAPEGTSEPDALSVMYAQSGEWPELPARKARFHRVEHLEIRFEHRRPVRPRPDLRLATRTASLRTVFWLRTGLGSSALRCCSQAAE